MNVINRVILGTFLLCGAGFLPAKDKVQIEVLSSHIGGRQPLFGGGVVVPLGAPPDFVKRMKDTPQVYLQIAIPDGSKGTLWCQYVGKPCRPLDPGKYDAQFDKEVVWVYHVGPDGKEEKVKYEYFPAPQTNKSNAESSPKP